MYNKYHFLLSDNQVNITENYQQLGIIYIWIGVMSKDCLN